MRRLRPADGTGVHRRAARYHISRCTKGEAPLHATLRDEMSAKLDALVAAARANEDAEDAEVAAGALVDAAELQVENAIRDLDADLEKLDRANCALGARAAVFPGGYGALIDPEADEQLKVLGPLRQRAAPFKGDPVVAAALAKIDAGEGALESAIKADEAAESAADIAEAAELAARAGIREQIESAYGRLRAHYKAVPTLAEKFFLKHSGRRRKTPPSE